MSKGLVWLLGFACLLVVGWAVWRARAKLAESRQAEEARAASFLAQAVARPAAGASAPAPQEALLFEAGGKAAQAGEPALAIQLYAKLIARFPAGPLAEKARAAAMAEKQRLATARAPGTSVPG